MPDSRARDLPGPDSAQPDAGAGAGLRYRLDVANPSGVELTEVPILVQLSPARVDYSRCGAQASRMDLYAEDGATALIFEIERWDPSGASTLWVKVPILEAADGATLWLLCGEDQRGPGLGPAPEVWQQGYAGVWHLSESPSGAVDEIRDSAGAMHGQSHGGMDSGDQIIGLVGGALRFDGVDDHVLVLDWATPRDAFTYSLWMRPADALDASSPRQDLIYHETDNRPHLTFNRGNDGAFGLHVRLDGVAINTALTTTTSWEASVWRQLSFTFDGSELRVYVDGAQQGAAHQHAGVQDVSEQLYIGARDDMSSLFAGAIDELRVARVARKPAWIAVQHASMRDQLVSYGAAAPY